MEDASIHKDYCRLLEEPKVDVVWVLTPPSFHAEIVLASFRHGKHVLCEKPLATSLEEMGAIRKALDRQLQTSRPLILMPAHNFIFTPCFDRALQIIRDGEIGRVEKIEGRALSNLGFYKAKTDFRTHAKGGVIEDQIPHLIYLSEDISGPCVRVLTVKPRTGRHTATQDVNIEAELEGGVGAELSAAWSGFIPTLKLDLIGESGRISLDLLRRPYNVLVAKGDEEDHIRMGGKLLQYLDVLRGHHPSYLNEHRHFVDVVNGAAEPRVTADSGFNLVRTLHEALRLLDERPTRTEEKPEISVVRVENDIEKAVRRSISLLGGLKIREDASVVVKPNVCSKRNTENMVVTDPRVLESVLRMVNERTKRIAVVESDNNSGSADERVKKTGILEVIEDCGAEFINLSRDECKEHRVSDIIIRLPKAVLEADYLINVPKIKTCNIENSVVSIAMKNMFGVVADKKKTRFHQRLNDVLLYICKILPRTTAIVDGVIAMEGRGPVWGTPVRLDLILSGFNPVTVDAVCCSVIGINPYAVDLLWRAYKEGLGEIDVSKVQVHGEEIEAVRRRFAHPAFLRKNITGAAKTALKTYLS